MAQIDAFFKLMHEQGASDLHMVAGQQPIMRIRGDMEAVKYKVLDNDELKGMLYEICPEDKIKLFKETGIWISDMKPPALHDIGPTFSCRSTASVRSFGKFPVPS